MIKQAQVDLSSTDLLREIDAKIVEFTKDNICWYDAVGDVLDRHGIAPGEIFEFHETIFPGTEQGGVVITVPERSTPPKRSEIIGVYLLSENGAASIRTMFLSPRNPRLISNLHRMRLL